MPRSAKIRTRPRRRGGAANGGPAPEVSGEGDEWGKEHVLPWEKGSGAVAETESLVRIYNAIM